MEEAISGYCRILDQARTVWCEKEAEGWTFDCAYPDCIHAAACPIAQQLRALEVQP